MEDILNKNVAKEIITILAYLDDELINKINPELLAKLTDLAADASIDVKIDLNKKLSEQNLSEECLNFIAYLYYEDGSFL